MLGRFYLVFACWMAALAIHAEPSNVLVGDLIFARPDQWVWQAPEGKSAAVTRFMIPDASGTADFTSASFYHGPKDAPAAFNAWKTRFPNAADLKAVQVDEKKINNRLLTYYTVTGTYVFAGRSRKNQQFIGAVMPSAGKFVHVLLVGPEENVRRITPAFKTMIENALKETQ